MADHDTHDHTGVPGVGTGTTTTTVADDPIWDAAGDLVVGTGANAAARLAAGSNGEVLTVVSGNPQWEPNAGPADILDMTTAEMDDTLVLAPDGAGGVEFRAESGSSGGGGFDGQRTIWEPPASAHATDDEFNDESGMSGVINGLDAKWSKRNLATGSWVQLSADAPGALVLAIPDGQTGDQAIYQTVPAGDWTYSVRFSSLFSATGSSRQMWGLLCVDSSGNGISAMLDMGPQRDSSNGVVLRELATWAGNSNLTVANQPGIEGAALYGAPVTLFMRKASGVYHLSWTYDPRVIGTSVLLEGNRTPTAFTPAYIGFGRFFSGGGIVRTTIDSFRKVA